MKPLVFVCPGCRKRYSVPAHRVPHNASAVRCKACGQVFPLQPEDSVRLARTVGVIISKGGVGKSTTAVNLAAGLALHGKRVLLVDTDTQGQASYLLGVKPSAGLTELVTGELHPDEAVHPVRQNLWLLAGGKSLAGIKRIIDRKDFGGENTLKNALDPLRTQYDFIVLDSSPGWDPLTVNVLFFVREILSPVALELLSLQSLREFLKSIATIRRYNHDLALKYLLPTFLDNRVKHPKELLEALNNLYPQYMCPPIRYSVQLAQAPGYGMSIFEYAPNSNAAYDYAQLVRAVLRGKVQTPDTKEETAKTA